MSHSCPNELEDHTKSHTPSLTMAFDAAYLTTFLSVKSKHTVHYYCPQIHLVSLLSKPKIEHWEKCLRNHPHMSGLLVFYNNGCSRGLFHLAECIWGFIFPLKHFQREQKPRQCSERWDGHFKQTDSWSQTLWSFNSQSVHLDCVRLVVDSPLGQSVWQRDKQREHTSSLFQRM